MLDLLILFNSYVADLIEKESTDSMMTKHSNFNSEITSKPGTSQNIGYNSQSSYSFVVAENLSRLMEEGPEDLINNKTNKRQPLQTQRQNRFTNNNNNNNNNRPKRVKDDTNERTVFVADLDPNHTEIDLVQLFRQVGSIIKVTKLQGNTFGYLLFEKQQTVKTVLKTATFELKGHPIRVMPYNQPEVFDVNANLIIKNLESYVNESHLIRKFERFGEILSCKVERDQYGKSRCFAYLQYKSAESAARAIDELNNTYWEEYCDPDILYKCYGTKLKTINNNYNNYNEIKGKKIFVGVFKKRDDYYRAKSNKEGRESNLYVKNLGTEFGDRDLYMLFKKFGSIKSAKIRRDKQTNCPLGCGFVDFEEPDDADKALKELDGHILTEFGGRVITVKYASCKSRRQRRKQEQENAMNNLNSSCTANDETLSVSSDNTNEMYSLTPTTNFSAPVTPLLNTPPGFTNAYYGGQFSNLWYDLLYNTLYEYQNYKLFN